MTQMFGDRIICEEWCECPGDCPTCSAGCRWGTSRYSCYCERSVDDGGCHPAPAEDTCRKITIEWFHTQRGSIGVCPVAERPGVWAWLTDRGGVLGLGESGVSGSKAYARTDAYVALVRATS